MLSNSDVNIDKKELDSRERKIELARNLLKDGLGNVIISTGYIEDLIGRENTNYPINGIEIIKGKSGFKLMKAKEETIGCNTIEYCVLKNKIKSVIDSIYEKDRRTDALICVIGNDENKREIYNDIANDLKEKYNKFNLKYEISSSYDCNKMIIMKELFESSYNK